MGSPNSEPERWNNEMQHEVTLTKGFWLADTTVTQALWELVMSANPSRFKGPDRPVENVSWDDAQLFINKMNGLKAELKLCLPTEAQWEYSCRAGSTAPFFWGEEIDSDLVNFNGTNPYNKGRRSTYRQETVDVQSLLCNDWGLYQMHGNVWEWCRDWFGEYEKTPIVDPQGAEMGDGRVLRGGSWLDFGRDCRSTCRSHFEPSSRFDDFGFRLARGH
jgi:formylglycine-generating enzyme required for sulfatase activity